MGRHLHLALREREDVTVMRRDSMGAREIARARPLGGRHRRRRGGRRLPRRGKCRRKTAECVRAEMPAALKGQPPASVTLDRGEELAFHAPVTEEIGVEFCFALPNHPRQRGTNENADGLLREYFPKGSPLSGVSEKRVREVHDGLNRRARSEKTARFQVIALAVCP